MPRALVRALYLVSTANGVDFHDGLLVGEQDPIPILPREVTPRRVHIEAQRFEDVVEVFACPRTRPRGDRALVDGEVRVLHHRFFRGHVTHAGALTVRAHALGGVRRKESEYKIPIPSGYVPTRENSSRTVLLIVETVPTVERAEPPEVDCCSATDGGSPSMEATCGSTAEAMSRRAKGATDSR